MPRGIMPRRPSRSGRQDKATSAADRAKSRIAASQPSKSGLSVASGKSPALAKKRLERGTQMRSVE